MGASYEADCVSEEAGATSTFGAGEMGKNRLIKVQSALLRPFHPPATEEAGALGGDEL